MIYQYVKYVTREISRTIECDEVCTELATVEGVTYVHVPDDYELPVQPAEVAESLQPVTLTPELRDAIKAASPHVWLINARVREKIADVYPLHEEIKLLRTAPSAEFDAYNEYAEECREWGRVQKALLGL